MSENDHKKLGEKITAIYLRKIKKWMYCPNCQNGIMHINKESTVWTCDQCGYELSADEFEDNYVFWFCDKCGAYLNNQDGFDRNASKFVCQKCGYENDITADNIKGECSDCGKLLDDPNATLCEDCKKKRKQKAKERLITVGKIAGAAIAIAGVAYFIYRSTQSGDENNLDDTLLPDSDNNGLDIDSNVNIESDLNPEIQRANEPEKAIDNVNVDKVIVDKFNNHEMLTETITDEEEALLSRLEAGDFNGIIGGDFDNDAGSTFWFEIKDGVPIQYRQGPGGKYFDGKENVRYDGVLRTNRKWTTNEQKLEFLRKYGYLSDDEDVKAYSAKFKPSR